MRQDLSEVDSTRSFTTQCKAIGEERGVSMVLFLEGAPQSYNTFFSSCNFSISHFPSAPGRLASPFDLNNEVGCALHCVNFLYKL
jgi:hypothetical protein